MQGKKNFTPQLFVSVNLLDLVPEDNFYRKLQTELDLDFIYKAIQKYYGKFNVQLEKISALYHQKTKCFSPSYFPETREVLSFCKNSRSKHQ